MAFGLVNPIHALGRAVAKIDAIQVPVNPKTTFNVGVIGGGTSVNSIPFEGWFEVDMRSPDAASLENTKDKILAAINEAVKEENERWNHKGEVTVDIKPVGYRPCGQTPPDSPIVATAQAAVRVIGLRPMLTASSTDSNVPMQLGVPAVTIGGGGIAKDAHALTESFDPKDSWKGPQYVLLLLCALAH
jgi:acetylornithine deacetylase/succinyl-diaminopimelate desuccinylase-like protein